MAPPKKFYTVACENKFAAFDQEDHVSSDDEVVFVKAPPPKDENSSAVRQPPARAGASHSEGQRKTGNESPSGRGGRGAGRGGYDSTGRAGRGEGGSFKGVRNSERSGDSSTRGAYRGGRGSAERVGRGRGGFRRDEGNGNGKRDADGVGEFATQESIEGVNERNPLGSAPHNGGQFRRDGNNYRGSYRGGRHEGGYHGNVRQFDRHSGTGRGRDLKKRGGGGYNWGNEGIDFGADQEISPMAFRATIEGEQSTDLGSKDSLDATPKTDDERPKANGVHEDHADNVEEKVEEPKEKKPDLIDLNEYKRLQEAKRANLPCFSKSDKAATSSTIDTQKEMEDEGYERYVKENSDDEEEDVDEDTGRPDDDDDSGKRKKKTLNFFEYIHQEGGRLRLFPGYRGRGRGRGRVSPGGYQREDGDKSSEYGKPRGVGKSPRRNDSRTGKRRDAPDLEDTRAFPTLA